MIALEPDDAARNRFQGAPRNLRALAGSDVPATHPLPRAKSRVVVVDDEQHVSFLVRVVLERAGFEVAEAANGGAALQLIADRSTQLVVTDRMMPGMNGPMLITRMRAHSDMASIPIVMISANPDLDADADAFLTKPFDPDELVSIANRLISGSDDDPRTSS